jgi:alpha-tubulin suppressor-like RCC1 family protein
MNKRNVMNHSRRKLLALLGLSLSLGVSAAQATDSLIWDSSKDAYIISKYSAIPMVVAAPFCSLALKSDGTVWSWGYNGYSQLGTGKPLQVSTPTQVTGIGGVRAIAAGETHALALKSNGTVWAWGANYWGQLGSAVPTGKTSGTPVQVAGLTDVTAVATGEGHSLALKSDGTVWAWGDDHSWVTNPPDPGRAGPGPVGTPTPTQVPGLTDVITISAHGYSSMAVKSDGSMWVWGQVLPGNGTDSYFLFTPVHLTYPTGIVAAQTGSGSIALRGDGTVFTWGESDSLLGLGPITKSLVPVMVTGVNGVMAVSAGDSHTAVLKSDGTVWTWGGNSVGQLGNGSVTSSSVPVLVHNSMFSRVGFGDVTKVSAGRTHTLALKKDGSVWAWGSNTYGELGNGSSSNYSRLPIKSLMNLY